MQNRIAAFKQHVRAEAANPDFVHHKWFVQWHLEIVERIAKELLEVYPQADPDLVEVMVWLHDYGKILDFANEYTKTLEAGPPKLVELGFDPSFAQKATDYIEILDSKTDIDKAPIEVQIVSSADGCSHMVGPFMFTIWHEGTDKTFPGKTMEELMVMNKAKSEKDWNKKVTLPEARAAFEKRHKHLLEIAGDLPERFLI